MPQFLFYNFHNYPTILPWSSGWWYHHLSRIGSIISLLNNHLHQNLFLSGSSGNNLWETLHSSPSQHHMRMVSVCDGKCNLPLGSWRSAVADSVQVALEAILARRRRRDLLEASRVCVRVGNSSNRWRPPLLPACLAHYPTPWGCVL